MNIASVLALRGLALRLHGGVSLLLLLLVTTAKGFALRLHGRSVPPTPSSADNCSGFGTHETSWAEGPLLLPLMIIATCMAAEQEEDDYMK